jgi:acetoin utilization deacetylase AcuC-like enzyme
VKEQDFIYPKQLSDHLVALSHDYDYINTINKLNLSKKEERKMGFPQSTELIVREKTIMNGTLLAALEAFEEKFTFLVKDHI